MSIILVLFIILLLFFCIKDRKMIVSLIQSILNDKIKSSNSNNQLIENCKIKNKKKEKKKRKKRKTLSNKDNKKNMSNNNEPPRKTKKHKTSINFEESKSSKRNMLSNSKSNEIEGKLEEININIIPIKNISYKQKNKEKDFLDNNENKSIKIYKQNVLNTGREYNSEESNNSIFNDEELNTMEYEFALINDKRTYFGYYWSLLKKKQLILFTFIPQKDYNLFTLKISLFLLSFSLYFTVNAFFFSDDTMHKIHKNNGEYNIFLQIPQILYSSVISTIINMILKMLSLSEKNILVIKNEKDFHIALKKSKNIERCITIKFIIFFILCNILLIFFWYFIACFCAVYTNTQTILIKDTLISFALSMIYPFGINLVPGIFRIPALRAVNKDKKCMYKISILLSLI